MRLNITNMDKLSPSGLKITMLGGLKVESGGQVIVLPKSRKARALIAYLAVSEKPVSKVRLGELLFSNTANPKANLRWCLSKFRALLNDHDKKIIGSDAENIWINCSSDAIDVRSLIEIRNRGVFNESEYDYLNQIGRLQFLPDLEVANTQEFETWRSTMQVHCERLLEETLEQAVVQNVGNDLALKYAQLFTECAPYSEQAWYLLITSLKTVNRTRHASRFLEIANRQLSEGGFMQTGLLALASQSLKTLNDNEINLITNLSYTQNFQPQIPKLVIDDSEVDVSVVAEFQEFLQAIESAAAANKSTVYVSTKLSEDCDLKLVPKFRKCSQHYVVEINLLKHPTGVCLSSWEAHLEIKPLNELVASLRGWLGVKFELDLTIALIGIAQSKTPESRTASDYYYLAFPKIYSPAGYAVHDAMALLRESLKLDPNYGPALCSMAWVRSTHPLYNQSEIERKETAGMARRSLELSYDDPFVLSWAATTLGHLECSPENGLYFANRAKSLNGYSPLVRLARGVLLHYMGEFSESLNVLEGFQHNPVEPISFIIETYSALNYYQLDNLEKAINFCHCAINQNPGYVVTLRTLVVCSWRIGETGLAQSYAKKLVALDASETLEYLNKYLPYKHERWKNRMIRDLESAGVPANLATSRD